MKSIERHQLKEDEFITTLQDTFLRIDEHRRQVLWAIVALVVIAVAVGGVIWWRQDVNTKAAALLAEAQVVAEAPVVPAAPPAAPGTTAPPPAPTPGSYPTERAKLKRRCRSSSQRPTPIRRVVRKLAARYAAAGTLVALGRPADAATRYQEVIDHAGSDIYGRMARLGLASVQAKQGKYRRGDWHVQGDGRDREGSAGGRHPDATRSDLRGGRQEGRSVADLQARDRRVPDVSVCGRREKRDRNP